jgi:hypothetical protein
MRGVLNELTVTDRIGDDDSGDRNLSVPLRNCDNEAGEKLSLEEVDLAENSGRSWRETMYERRRNSLDDDGNEFPITLSNGKLVAICRVCFTTRKRWKREVISGIDSVCLLVRQLLLSITNFIYNTEPNRNIKSKLVSIKPVNQIKSNQN